MAGIPLEFANNATHISNRFGFFFKFGSNPSNNVALLDLDGGVSGNFRLTLTPDPTVIAEYNCGGQEASGPVTNTMILHPGSWYYISGFFGGGAASGQPQKINMQLWAPGGVTDGPVSRFNSISGSFNGVVNCNLGWGVHLSSTYDDFPNASGWEMAVLELTAITTAPADDNSPPSPPTSDPSPSGKTALYLCHQPLGPVSTVTDSTSNHYDLTPGGNGAKIVSDGPY